MSSLQKRVVSLLASIIIIVMLVTSIVVQIDVKNSFYSVELQHARNLLNQVFMTVENEYINDAYHREALYDERRSLLSNSTEMALGIIERAYSSAQQGEMSEAMAMEQAKDILRGMRYDGGVGYFWIQDDTLPIPNMIMHPVVPELEGRLGDHPMFYEALPQEQNVLAYFVQELQGAEDSIFASYQWPKPTDQGLSSMQPKLSRIEYFEPWGWIIGTGVYIDDIERDSQIHLKKLQDILFSELGALRIAQSGYFYIFDSNGDFILHPTMQGTNGMDLVNPDRGTLILEDLMEAAENPLDPYRYRWTKPDGDAEHNYWKVVLLDYFEPWDWYMGVSSYEDELEAPANKLRSKILYISFVSLLISLFIAWWLAKSLSDPLETLSRAARKIELKGYSNEDIPIVGTKEMRELGYCFQGMLDSLQTNQDELKGLQTYLTGIINSMPSILIAVDMEGCVQQWNSEAQRSTGLSAQDVYGKPVGEVYPHIAKDIPQIMEAILQEKHYYEPRRISFDKEQRVFEDLTVFPLKSQEGQGGVIRLDDVTQRVHMEEMMVQSEKMLSLGGLAAGMAHEINNPLGGMLQTAEVLENRLCDRTMQANIKGAEEAGMDLEGLARYLEIRKIPHMLDRMRHSGRRAAEIVRNMLGFARKKEQGKTLSHIPALLDQCVELCSVDYNLKKHYDFRQIEIKRNYQENLPPVLCDAAQIQQVFMNLLRNGAEAMMEHQKEGLSTDKPCFNLVIFQKEEELIIEIEDNGPGIHKEEESRIFEPFFTTKANSGGTGLGLSVSYFIVTENHGGSMRVESTPGRGTLFTISLVTSSVV